MAENMVQVAAIILAAGGSVRMGRPKQLLTIGGQPMVRRVTQAVCATGLAQVVAIVGAQAEKVQQALAGLPVEVIVNSLWEEGLATSLRAGLHALRPEIQAAMIVLADQPALTPALLQTLVDRYRISRAPIVVPFYSSQRGNPVLFDRSLFPELLAAEGDQGGRVLIQRYDKRLERVQIDDAAVLMDIDTRQDYENLKLHKLRDLKHLIIDMDGVLYRGNELIHGAGDLLSFLRQQGIGFVLATNNATRTPQQFVDKLAGMGVAVDPAEILTSAQATTGYLQDIASPGARVFVVGMDGLWSALREAGFNLVERDAEYVVVGMDFAVCYERLAEATLQIRAGAGFIGTNPDLTFPSERGIVPGAGSLLAFLEASTGVKPTVIGKPETTMLQQAMARAKALPATTAVLGDRLETDILAGQRAGLATLLVLSGVTDRTMLTESDIQPDLVFDDVAHLHTVWEKMLGD
jgi:4-nitrophenyl phosphatase